MDRDNLRVAGSLFFVGGAQFVILVVLAEVLYPGYNASTNYISDLGATCVGSSCVIHQPTATIFNSSVFVLGLLGFVGAYFVYRTGRHRKVAPFLFLTAAGAMGVGLFPETTGMAHTIASIITFVFAGLSGIATYRLQRPPLSYFSVILGAATLAATGLFAGGYDLGLGVGGMERMIAYPALVWLIGLGSHLIGTGDSQRFP